MASVYANWVDGTNVCPQREGYFLSKVMGGKGATFRTHTAPGSAGEWFQWSIPTPVIINNQRSSIKKVFILYETVGTAKIMAIHVYDSNIRIGDFPNLQLSGAHWANVDTTNSWDINPPHSMKFGVGISVLVDFGPASPIGVPEITFMGAGADFVLP